MPAHIKIIHALEFIKATPEGTLDLEETKKLLLEIASVSTPLVEYEILLDIRKTQSELSIANLWYLADELNKFRKTFTCKTAVLCPVEQFDHVGFFALCSQNRGFQVRAFTSYEGAMEWLLESKPITVDNLPPSG
jgi:hypothetical protein